MASFSNSLRLEDAEWIPPVFDIPSNQNNHSQKFCQNLNW
jgi:hypothetical protein